jgi:hypothetical protein
MKSTAMLSACILALAGQVQAQGSADTMPLRVVEQAEKAFYADDAEALMKFYAPNVEGYTLPAGDSAGKGPRDFEQTRTAYAEFFKKWPKQHGRMVASIVHGPYVVRQYISEGSARSGKGLWIFEITGGRIRRFWNTQVPVPLD